MADLAQVEPAVIEAQNGLVFYSIYMNFISQTIRILLFATWKGHYFLILKVDAFTYNNLYTLIKSIYFLWLRKNKISNSGCKKYVH